MSKEGVRGKLKNDKELRNLLEYWLRSDDVDLAIEAIVTKAEPIIEAETRKQTIKDIKKRLPKELGFDDYDKHMHTYGEEGRGKCGVCGLSWKKATEYEYYNNAIIQVKKMLSKYGIQETEKQE